MEGGGKSFKDYLQIARRRKYYIAIPMLLLFAISILVALLLPPLYRSEATILIEQQHIPVDLVKSTVVSFADERIQQIQQKIMRIDNVNKIISKYGLYGEERSQLSATELAEKFTENVELEVISADVISQGKKSKATLAFNLSFDHKKAMVAQKVTNELVTSFLIENTRSRTDRAKETAAFLEEESKKVNEEIQKIENQLAEYKEDYSESLPEFQPVNLSSISRIENPLQQLSLQERMLNERKSSLRSQMAMTSPVIAISNGSDQLVIDSLPALEAEYAKLLGKYSKSHPDVRSIKRKIDHFDQTKHSGKKSMRGINNPIYLQLRNELQMSTVEGDNIKRSRLKFIATLKKLEMNIAQSHQVERGYNDLMRALEGHRTKYQELTAKFMDAKLAQTLEEEQKAEKFSILEPPRVPTKPEKPDRLKIIFIGFALSLFSGLASAYLAEAMDGSIRGQEEIVKITGEEPLVVIPYLINDDDLAKSRKNKINFIILGLIVLMSMVAAIHFLYMHLDIIFYKVLHKAEEIMLS